ncbi:MAG: tripartite tricarboxylate transporter permease [Angelakisella sp.]|jgi:putative tricarboxylic transport membrane protein|nr:tripartite tricarboxylate transporter permease [Angelakisella sp.]MCI9528519.1 tripartite tricarboxylate transporter permease [Angelakisella sp.]
MFSEWLFLPQAAVQYLGEPMVWLFLLLGTVCGFLVGVMPGLGPTMGMALCLGIVFKLPPAQGLALLVGIFVAAVGSGGITASLLNIPGTAAAAATCIDGYALSRQGKSREAAGYSVAASVIGTVAATVLIFLIQPFITAIALKFGDWETFLFCLFGLLVCGSLSGASRARGWLSALGGCFVAMCGADGVQSVLRFTFGRPELLSGVDSVVAMLGLFGIGEVLYTLGKPPSARVWEEVGFPRVNLPVLLKNGVNILRSVLAGMWIGFIPGIGESAACWFSYDLAKRTSRQKERFGHGSEEGIIAAETANNASSVGALIPALALGIPGSSTVAMFLSAMYILGFRPGPTLLLEAPGFLCGLCLLLLAAALALGVVAFLCAPFAIKLLSLPEHLLMPFIAVLCAVGAYGTTNTPFALVQLAVFGLLGYLMKRFQYPIAPFVLGLLVGKTADTALRRALMQYAGDFSGMLLRPFGLVILVVLSALLVLGLKSGRRSKG